MKKINYLFPALSIIILLSALNIFSQFINPAINNPVIPDVMGYVNILESNGKYSNNSVINVDSFPHFSGFPKTLSGTTFEGGILCNMDGDNDLEIVFNIGYTVQVWNYDGTSVSGWPQTVASYALEGAPAYGDIDGDGQEEIVVTNHGLTSGGFIYAFRKNGTPVPGFPINHGYSSRTPVLANMDNAGGLEIIVNKRLSGSGEVWIYRGNAATFPGWPKTLNHVPASSAAVGDITGDALPEVVMESYSGLFAWGSDGNPLAGFPYLMPNSDVNSYSSPVLADVDGDNIREIIFGTHVLGGGGYVYILKNNGTVLSGWPNPTTQWIYGPPAVGYIDGDNIIDIAVGDQVLSGSPSDQLYAWNKNGTYLAGFPVPMLWAINNQISIADIDNDNSMELICDDNTQTGGRGKYLAFNHDGSPVAGWDVNTSGATFFTTPMLGDVNRDGLLDIAGAGCVTSPATANIYLWNTGTTFNANKIIIPMWQYNSRHNGVYGDNPLVGISPVSNTIPKNFELKQNYPNPFNPVTKIKFSIAGVKGTSGNVFTKLTVYDIGGKTITQLIKSELVPGEYETDFNASGLASGIYFYELNAGGMKLTNKMVLVK
ncbi:MAG TPA: T9SS type A sorting domain-containing protein [Ignavibacteria bacterium]|nr:T9SS type A sorting domain-containing protein [Ignavibacteria bacterium]HMQ97750.1 T9SS type A sorting domain-containing protein [Ignavibacteria bacterium]